MKKDFFQKISSQFTIEDWTPKLITCLKGYNREKFAKDLMAGLVVGIVALPLAMAFGIASGVSPEKGLVTAIIGGFIVSALGGSSVQIAGPTGAYIVLVYNTVANYGIEGLLVTTVMTGLMLILMGVLKLGVIMRFIPYPITVGFMSGIAVIIFTTQMKDFFGMEIYEVMPPDFLSKWRMYFQYLHTIDIITLLIGIASLVIIIFSYKISKKIPGSLLAVVIVSFIVYILREYVGITSISTIGDQFDIDGTLPGMATDVKISIAMINELFPTAFTMAILGAIESLISASIADGVTGDRHKSNLELVAQGVANIFTGIFGGIPATGALARTVTNVNNGGRTPIAGIVHCAFLLLVTLFLGSLIKHIPMVCLAAVLIIVSYNMAEWRSFVNLLKNSKADVAVLLTTFLLTLIFDLTIAIEVGLLLSVFLFLKRTNEVSQVSVSTDKISLSLDYDYTDAENELFSLPRGIEVYEIDGPFFFGLANKFEESMRVIGSKAKVRIIRMRKVPFIDSTGLVNLTNLCNKSIGGGIHVILSGVRPEVRKMIEKSEIESLIGKENICPNIQVALDRAEKVLSELKAEEEATDTVEKEEV